MLLNILNSIFAMGAIAMLILVLTALFFLRSVGRHFDKLFKDKIPKTAILVPDAADFIRALNYGKFLVFDKWTRGNSERMKLYGDYNFKRNATKFQIVISYIFLISGYTMLLSAAIYYIGLFINYIA